MAVRNPRSMREALSLIREMREIIRRTMWYDKPEDGDRVCISCGVDKNREFVAGFPRDEPEKHDRDCQIARVLGLVTGR